MHSVGYKYFVRGLLLWRH